MQQQIYPQVWINLPKETRLHLVKVFGLERTGVTEIRDQEVVSDGFTVDDLKRITLEKMCEYIGSEETFGRAWEITLAKVHSELNPPIGEIKRIDGEPTIVEVLDTVEEVKEEIIEEKNPWCSTCDSKGVRHKKECPKYEPVPKRGEGNPFAKQLQ